MSEYQRVDKIGKSSNEYTLLEYHDGIEKKIQNGLSA